LRPASFEASWTGASLPDFLRLVRGDDLGIRGNFEIAVNAQTAANGWAIQGQAQLTQLHRWDLTARSDAPSIKATAQMMLDVPNARVELTEVSIEGLRSNLQAAGRVAWSTAAENTGKLAAMPRPLSASRPTRASGVSGATQQAATPVNFEIKSASIDAQDLVAWLRAFRANVPDALTATGFVHGQGSVGGWPLRVTNATVASNGVVVAAGGLVAPVRVGPMQIAFDNGALQVAPVTMTLGGTADADAGSFRFEMLPRPKRAPARAGAAGFHFSGIAADSQTVVAVANAFGWDVARGWRLAGPLHCDLRWPALAWPWQAEPVGTVALGGDGDDAASLHAPFLNLPVSGLAVRMDWKPGARHVTLAAADAFGAHWTGTFDRNTAAPGWQFALSADRLDAADLDRWLNPRWRESFIDRVLPFLTSSTPSNAVPEELRGSGRLSVGEFLVAPFALEDLSGDLRVAGREITLENGQAQISGGDVSGSLDANLSATPSYRASADFSNVDVGELGGSSQRAATFGGVGSGHAQFSMQGTSRADFGNTLECDGTADMRSASWRGFDLLGSLQAGRPVAGSSTFADASGQFACADGAVSLKNMVLSTARAEIDGTGTISFARDLSLALRARTTPSGVVGPAEYAPGDASNAVVVTGTLSAPQFRKATPGQRSR
jgi:hypothetical protein